MWLVYPGWVINEEHWFVPTYSFLVYFSATPWTYFEELLFLWKLPELP